MYRLWTKDKCHYGAKCRFAHVNSGNYDVFKGGIEGKFTKPIEKEVCVYCEKTGHSHTKCFKLKRDKKKAAGEDKRPDIIGIWGKLAVSLDRAAPFTGTRPSAMQTECYVDVSPDSPLYLTT